MSMPRISVYIREKQIAGGVITESGKVADSRPGMSICLFFTRRQMHGKQVWKGLYAETFRDANQEAAHLSSAIATEPNGLTAAQTEPSGTVNRILLATAVETYL